ncbi:MAG: dehydrogenase [Actinomyces ruminicola]|uniref:Myo-inositol 2-dehydrogenase / D-chiro-inositol 1-dehydrogenase n=1 Tax=Actinomyces ruminicola TaxID=332524 RepID=A0A1G9XND0_9ACTO|nr:Gfo/Idh/MocA family oxidoreductase [Actinomyces ruminicola]MBE6481738.1 dehydrogenase [Actinomyces ruminicola]SDM98264.1 myo-inositol 2-dehydrogenase / D-chiro-inositol 1-dehydrogenase [Actinomyces ruminicola]
MTVTNVNLALVGAGRIGNHHARALAREVPGAVVTTVVDPRTEAAAALAAELGAQPVSTIDEAVADPDLDAVLITTPAALHAPAIITAAKAAKHVFTEKPITTTIEDAHAAIDACTRAGVRLQVGFNRRFAPGFAAAHAAVSDGRVGEVRQMRSVTRDPGPFSVDPAKIAPWTMFLETLIHDFDTLLWLNPGAEVVSVTAHADALVRPDAKPDGFIDTATVTLVFDTGAMATAEACFEALYGYDVRGEVFGAKGMATAGCGRTSDMTYYGADGASWDTSRKDTDLLHTAYVGELDAFVRSVRGENVDVPGAEAGLRALRVARAAILSVRENRTVSLKEIAE